MKRETELTINDKAIVYGFVDTGKFGDCIQDKYLIQLEEFLSDNYINGGMSMSYITRKPKDYVFVEHYRTICDALHSEKNVYAYFDYPVSLSALYVATFDKNMKAPLIHAVEQMKANYKMTSVGITPITIKIDMVSFLKGEFLRKDVGQSLKYLHELDSIKYSTQLFDVIDTSQQPKIIYASR
jgi:hypothetical protein